MTDQIDHYSEAISITEEAGRRVDGLDFSRIAVGNPAYSAEARMALYTKAQVEATLALVDAQREANEHARIANLLIHVTNADRLPPWHKEWIEEEMGL